MTAIHENQRGELTFNDTAGSLKVGGGKPGQGYPAVAVNLRGRDGGAMPETDALASMRAANGGSSRSYVATSCVRRLTETECERLQGFPDGFTAVPGLSSGARYKALGNSMAVPVMRWLGKRIALVEAELARIIDRPPVSDAHHDHVRDVRKMSTIGKQAALF